MTFSGSFNVASGGLFSGVKNAYILEFKDIIMCILWTRILPQGCITVSWLPLLCLFIPSLLKLAIDWISPLEMALKNGSEDKASACKVEDLGSIPVSGRSPGEGKGNPLQDSCLEKSYGWRSLVQATVHGVTKSQTWLSDFTYFSLFGNQGEIRRLESFYPPLWRALLGFNSNMYYKEK